MDKPRISRPAAGAPPETPSSDQEYLSPVLCLEERLRAGVRFPVELALVTGYLSPARFAVQGSPSRRAQFASYHRGRNLVDVTICVPAKRNFRTWRCDMGPVPYGRPPRW